MSEYKEYVTAVNKIVDYLDASEIKLYNHQADTYENT